MMNKFLQEIYGQPKALEDTLNYYLEVDGKAQLGEISQVWAEGKFRQVLFTGMGSSYFAPHMASCLLSSYGTPSFVINAGELLHYHLPLLQEGSLVVFVSQSGESYEVVKALEKLPAKVTCIGITNEEGSTLSKKVPLSLYSKAGEEEMTSTKTFVSTLLVLDIFAHTLVDKWDTQRVSEIKQSILAVESLISGYEGWLAPAMEFLGQPPFVQLIGRGPVYSTVQQSALMFKEGARTPASGLYGGEFRHGPMEMVKESFRAVVFAPKGKTYGQAIKLSEDITRFGGRVILVTNSLSPLNNPGIFPVHIPCQDEHLFTIPATVPLQFMVNQWALDQGFEPGDFLVGAKVTSTE